jgi:methylmalonyl-CoA/ethylmalonyl-CoA epimerase
VRVDHIGIAVPNILDALRTWEPTLGVSAGAVEDVASQGVRVAFLDAETAHIELIEPTSPTSGVAKFLSTRGGGIHHVAFAVPSVNQALAEAESRGLRLIDKTARPGARGRRVGFAHPSTFGGVLVEFVEGP